MEVKLAVVFLIQQLLQDPRVVVTAVRRRGGDGAPGVGAVVGAMVRQQVTYPVHFGALVSSRAATSLTSIRSRRRPYRCGSARLDPERSSTSWYLKRTVSSNFTVEKRENEYPHLINAEEEKNRERERESEEGDTESDNKIALFIDRLVSIMAIGRVTIFPPRIYRAQFRVSCAIQEALFSPTWRIACQ